MNKWYRILAIIIVSFILLLVSSNTTVSGYFSNSNGKNTGFLTGSVDVKIEDLQIKRGEFRRLHADDPFSDEVVNGGTIRLDTITSFRFQIINYGNNAVQYRLSLSIAFYESFHESGKFLLYPSHLSDEQILADVNTGLFQAAIINDTVSGLNDVLTNDGEKKGILQVMDEGIINSSNNESSDYDSIEYAFKLYFYNDLQIKETPALFDSHNVELGILVDANLSDRDSNWRKLDNKNIKFLTKTDFSVPVIEEIINPKTYFIQYGNTINLKDYAIATDAVEGDITNRIIITSEPLFNPNEIGTYTITYNASNSSGRAAVPLQITITIWNFKKITSGNYNTLALSSHGKVYAWGYNSSGQLGDGTTAYSANPKLVAGLSDIIDVAAGDYCSYALDKDGQAYAWGYNLNGRLGDGTTIERRRPVPVLQPSGVKFVQIAASYHTAGGVTAEGDVYTWGYANYGASGNGTRDENHQPTKINLTNISTIDLGYYNGAAVSKDGLLYTWGDNLNGQLGLDVSTGVGTNAPAIVSTFADANIKIASVSVGWYHMAAVTEEGKLYTWGYGAEGRLGNGSTNNQKIPQLINIDGVVQKAVAKTFQTGALTTNNKVYLWGQNTYGKLGTGNQTNQHSPVLLAGVLDVVDLSLAYDSSFVVTKQGVVFGMGYGGTGVLGTGNNNNSTQPVAWSFIPPQPE